MAQVAKETRVLKPDKKEQHGVFVAGVTAKLEALRREHVQSLHPTFTLEEAVIFIETIDDPDAVYNLTIRGNVPMPFIDAVRGMRTDIDRCLHPEKYTISGKERKTGVQFSPEKMLSILDYVYPNALLEPQEQQRRVQQTQRDYGVSAAQLRSWLQRREDYGLEVALEQKHNEHSQNNEKLVYHSSSFQMAYAVLHRYIETLTCSRRRICLRHFFHVNNASPSRWTRTHTEALETIEKLHAETPEDVQEAQGKERRVFPLMYKQAVVYMWQFIDAEGKRGDKTLFLQLLKLSAQQVYAWVHECGPLQPLPTSSIEGVHVAALTPEEASTELAACIEALLRSTNRSNAPFTALMLARQHAGGALLQEVSSADTEASEEGSAIEDGLSEGTAAHSLPGVDATPPEELSIEDQRMRTLRAHTGKAEGTMQELIAAYLTDKGVGILNAVRRMLPPKSQREHALLHEDGFVLLQEILHTYNPTDHGDVRAHLVQDCCARLAVRFENMQSRDEELARGTYRNVARTVRFPSHAREELFQANYVQKVMEVTKQPCSTFEEAVELLTKYHSPHIGDMAEELYKELPEESMMTASEIHEAGLQKFAAMAHYWKPPGRIEGYTYKPVQECMRAYVYARLPTEAHALSAPNVELRPDQQDLTYQQEYMRSAASITGASAYDNYDAAAKGLLLHCADEIQEHAQKFARLSSAKDVSAMQIYFSGLKRFAFMAYFWKPGSRIENYAMAGALRKMEKKAGVSSA